MTEPSRTPDVSLRPCHGAADHPGMLRVRRACQEAAGIDPHSPVEPLPALEDIADAGGDQVVAEHDGNVVGHAGVWSWTERDGTVVYLHRGWVLPGLRGRGIGTALVRWAEDRTAQLVAEHDTAERACLGANAADSEPEAVALLKGLGYAHTFSVVELALPDLRRLPVLPEVLPEKAELRPVKRAHLRPVWEMICAAEADTAFTSRDFDGFATRADTAHWQVAWDAAGVAGGALCVAGAGGSGVGEVRELHVREDLRRRGLGRALLLTGLHSLARHGERSARLFTGTANPYRSYDLYGSVGFRRAAVFCRYRKPFG